MYKISELMAKDQAELTDDELRWLLDQFGDDETKKTKPEEKPPEKFSVTLADGTVLEAKTPEELTAVLKAKLEEYREDDRTIRTGTQQPSAGPTKDEWEYEKFKKLFLEDPRTALDYADRSQYGMPIRAMVPALVMAMVGINKRLQEGDTVRFTSEHRDYPGTPESRRVLEEIIARRGWDTNYQTLSDAYAIAKAEGKFKAQEPEKKEDLTPKPFIPPRAGNAPEESTTLAQLIQKGEKMPLEDLAKVIAANGGPNFSQLSDT